MLFPSSNVSFSSSNVSFTSSNVSSSLSNVSFSSSNLPFSSSSNVTAPSFENYSAEGEDENGRFARHGDDGATARYEMSSRGAKKALC